jgi:hypothetical protein
MVVGVIVVAALVVVLVLRFGTQERAAAVEESLHQSANLLLFQDRIEPERIDAIEGRALRLYVTAMAGDHTIEIPPLAQPQRVLDQQAISLNMSPPTPGVYPIIVEGPTGRIEGELAILEVIGQEVPPREPAGGPEGQ